MIFCYGGVIGSSNVITKALEDGEGKDGPYNSKLTQDQISTIGTRLINGLVMNS